MIARIHLVIGLIAFAWSAGGWLPELSAQLNLETQELFEKLAPELDSVLRAKFEKAVRDKQSAIEFTPEEFIRFRNHPANPFAGLENIDPYAEPGLIRLEFKIPSIRDRIPENGERQSPDQLECFRSAAARAAQSTVQILADDEWVSLGTVIVSAGLIITKASEIEPKAKLVCRWNQQGESRDFPATVLRIDERNDVALLKVECKDLIPANFEDREIVPGSFVVTPDATGRPLVMGVVSTVKRSLIGINQAYMGVRPINGPSGVELAEITSGGSAELAGLRPGDVVTKIGDTDVHSVTDLVNAIRLHQPGDQIEIQYARRGEPQAIQVTLAGRNLGGERAARFNMMNQFGTIPSERRDDFPLVFQHDSPLLPEYCGGPLVDIDGHVIGMNIARSGRVASFAIGSAEVRTIVDRLLRENVASLK